MGDVVGDNVGDVVGAPTHVPAMQVLVLQSESRTHAWSISQGLHLGPPQSTSVSWSSFTPVRQRSPVGAGVVGDCVGAGVGVRVGAALGRQSFIADFDPQDVPMDVGAYPSLHAIQATLTSYPHPVHDSAVPSHSQYSLHLSPNGDTEAIGT